MKNLKLTVGIAFILLGMILSNIAHTYKEPLGQMQTIQEDFIVQKDDSWLSGEYIYIFNENHQYKVTQPKLYEYCSDKIGERITIKFTHDGNYKGVKDIKIIE